MKERISQWESNWVKAMFGFGVCVTEELTKWQSVSASNRAKIHRHESRIGVFEFTNASMPANAFVRTHTSRTNEGNIFIL